MKNRGATPSVAATGVAHPSDATVFLFRVAPWHSVRKKIFICDKGP